MKQDSYFEVEVKLYVPDLEAVAARLKHAHAALVTPRTYEYNVRYENQDETLSANRIVLRLRKDERVRLTYKEPTAQIHGDIPVRFEAEVDVNDMEAMAVILEKLGYHPYLTYEKYRTTYRLHNAEVVLDEMPYGNFVEIEGAPEDIREVLQLIDLEKAPQYRANYIRLFENVRQNMGLTFKDLSFENFKGITVPETALAAPNGEEQA
ncbi:MAG: hypothetical protein OHK0046_26940 [Anaerolineae bacterium]